VAAGRSFRTRLAVREVVVSESVLSPVRAPFRALAACIVPEAAALDARGWADLERIVEEALASRPPALGGQVRLLVRVLDLLPVLRYGRRFAGLTPTQALRFLTAVQDAPLLLLRRGVWGLRTLVFMGYYARPEGGAAIGYRADPRGWEARR
jgi:hypothetical protein